MDKWYGSWSAKKKHLNEVQAIEFAAAVDKVSSDPLLIIMVALSEIKYGIVFMLLVMIMFGMSGLSVLLPRLPLPAWVIVSFLGLLCLLFVAIAIKSLDTLKRFLQASRLANQAKHKFTSERGL